MSKKIIIKFIFTIIFIFIVLPIKPAITEVITGCHCYQNRDYDPRAKFAADDYLLTTCFNSLMANYFNLSKKEIIRLKMKGGASQEELLLALQLSKISGLKARQLLISRQHGYSWEKIIATSSQFAKISNHKLWHEIKAGRPTSELGQEIADNMIADFYAQPIDKIIALRQNGFSEKEINLLYCLTTKSREKPEKIIQQIKRNGKSWSEVAHDFGLSPAMAGQFIINHKKG